MTISYGVEVQEYPEENQTVYAVISIENRDFCSDPAIKTYLDYCGSREEAQSVVDYLYACHEAH
ncbi:hypothetical protein F9K96_05360 [Brucella anthropi]|uniref:hypothetical protein n=1 Tax=Brucella anthropi TaxID=529 RepID=UPI00124DA2CD|nr:hypothetical protein [Brucella anthropi]KAB2792571.1 hypothetical protein F9K96_05360 [Brucella anthropi]